MNICIRPKANVLVDRDIVDYNNSEVKNMAKKKDAVVKPIKSYLMKTYIDEGDFEDSMGRKPKNRTEFRTWAIAAEDILCEQMNFCEAFEIANEEIFTEEEE